MRVSFFKSFRLKFLKVFHRVMHSCGKYLPSQLSFSFQIYCGPFGLLLFTLVCGFFLFFISVSSCWTICQFWFHGFGLTCARGILWLTHFANNFSESLKEISYMGCLEMKLDLGHILERDWFVFNFHSVDIFSLIATEVPYFFFHKVFKILFSLHFKIFWRKFSSQNLEKQCSIFLVSSKMISISKENRKRTTCLFKHFLCSMSYCLKFAKSPIILLRNFISIISILFESRSNWSIAYG